MKKIIPFILILLLLAACVKDPHPHGTEEVSGSTAGQTEGSTEDAAELTVAANKAVDVFPEAVRVLAEERAGAAQGYELGTGIYANVLTDSGIEQNDETDVYPLFKDGQLDAVIYRNGDYKMTDDQNKLTKIGKMMEGEFSVIQSDEGTAFIGRDEIVGIDEEKIAEKLEQNKQILAVREGKLEKNPFGSERIRVRKAQTRNDVRDPETGKLYSSTRIVVTLTENNDEVVRQIEEELGVTLYRKMSQGKICVFVTPEPKYFDELKELVKKAGSIAGVKFASLDMLNELHSYRKTPPSAII
ncbi:MAG: hypothetical protein IJM50_01735 [Lachnospiraceae bacterium]|nr:hypothetical protein [Lachnospiraceae bacterium]